MPTTQPGTARLGLARVACLSMSAGGVAVENAFFLLAGAGAVARLHWLFQTQCPLAAMTPSQGVRSNGSWTVLWVVEGHAPALGLALLSRLGVLGGARLWVRSRDGDGWVTGTGGRGGQGKPLVPVHPLDVSPQGPRAPTHPGVVRARSGPGVGSRLAHPTANRLHT